MRLFLSIFTAMFLFVSSVQAATVVEALQQLLPPETPIHVFNPGLATTLQLDMDNPFPSPYPEGHEFPLSEVAEYHESRGEFPIAGATVPNGTLFVVPNQGNSVLLILMNFAKETAVLLGGVPLVTTSSNPF